MPDVTDRDGYSQFTPDGLRSPRILHPGPQNAQFKLADTSFHPQKKSVIRPSGIVYTVGIDNARFNYSTQFEQVVPVSAVAREARGIKAQNRSYFVGAQQSEQPIESGANNRTIRCTSQIIINDFNICEPVVAGYLDQVALQPLALQVAHYLGRRRLTDVYDRLPL
jgi:hypothetical protein